MRIITGKLKGRTLAAVPQKGVRPAMDKVRATIFNMLQNRLSLAGAVVLDLYAGSGSLGFEAISRGAAAVVFVDDNHEALSTLRENARRLGCEEACRIVQADVLGFLKGCRESFHLVFADPPYKAGETPELPSEIFQRGLVLPGGLLIIEHDRHTGFEPVSAWTLGVQKEFGNTRVSFFTHPPPSEEGETS